MSAVDRASWRDTQGFSLQRQDSPKEKSNIQTVKEKEPGAAATGATAVIAVIVVGGVLLAAPAALITIVAWGSGMAVLSYLDSNNDQNIEVEHARAVQNNNDAQQESSESLKEKKQLLKLQNRVHRLMSIIDEKDADLKNFKEQAIQNVTEVVETIEGIRKELLDCQMHINSGSPLPPGIKERMCKNQIMINEISSKGAEVKAMEILKV